MGSQKILILGAGVGGVSAARLLSNKLAKHKVDYEIILISKNEKHYIPPLFLDVAIGEASPDDTWIPLLNFGKKYNIKIIIDNIYNIDGDNRKVKLASGRELDYDYLVVSLGTTMEWSRYSGLEKAGYHNYSLNSAINMKHRLMNIKDNENIVVLVPEVPYRCGIYPVEIATLLAETLRIKGIKYNIKIISPGPAPMPGLGPDIQNMIKEAFDKYGIEYVEHKGLEEVDVERRIIKARNIDEKYDLLIKVPPPGLPEPLKRSEGFQSEKDPRWAPVKAPLFKHPKYSEVYLIGEHSMPPAGLSLAGVFVHNASFVASNAILGDIIGFYPLHRFPSTVCAGYLGFEAFIGICEPRYNPQEGKYEWKKRCYKGLVTPLLHLFKFGFYRMWLNTLR